MPAANSFTSRTDPVSGGFVAHICPATKNNTMALVKYTAGNGNSTISLAVAFLPKADKGLSTDLYQMSFLAVADRITVTVQTFTVPEGNFVIPISIPDYAAAVEITPTFTGGDTSVCVIDFMDQ
jgi:hypothetical protein